VLSPSGAGTSLSLNSSGSYMKLTVRFDQGGRSADGTYGVCQGTKLPAKEEICPRLVLCKFLYAENMTSPSLLLCLLTF